MTKFTRVIEGRTQVHESVTARHFVLHSADRVYFAMYCQPRGTGAHELRSLKVRRHNANGTRSLMDLDPTGPIGLDVYSAVRKAGFLPPAA